MSNFFKRAALGIAVIASSAAGAAHAGQYSPVYFVHGFSGNPGTAPNTPLLSGYDCTNTLYGPWPAFYNYMADIYPWNNLPWLGALSGNRYTVGYYKGDIGCDKYLGANMGAATGSTAPSAYDTAGNADANTSIDTIARELAWLIYKDQHPADVSKTPAPAMVVAHSMGGLVIRRAIQGVSAHLANYPPSLDIRLVITMGSPHGGIVNCMTIASNVTPLNNRQCSDMLSDASTYQNGQALAAPLIPDLANNPSPQASNGTQWVLFGSTGDTVIDYDANNRPSSMDMAGAMEYVYYTDSKTGGAPAPGHNDFVFDNNGAPGGDALLPFITRSRAAQIVTNDPNGYLKMSKQAAQTQAQEGVNHWMKEATRLVLSK